MLMSIPGTIFESARIWSGQDLIKSVQMDIARESEERPHVEHPKRPKPNALAMDVHGVQSQAKNKSVFMSFSDDRWIKVNQS